MKGTLFVILAMLLPVSLSYGQRLLLGYGEKPLHHRVHIEGIMKNEIIGVGAGVDWVDGEDWAVHFNYYAYTPIKITPLVLDAGAFIKPKSLRSKWDGLGYGLYWRVRLPVFTFFNIAAHFENKTFMFFTVYIDVNQR